MTTASEEHDFRQLAGRFNQPIAPSPSFTLKLRSMFTDATLTSALSSDESNLRPQEIVLEREDIEDRWTPPRWMRTVEAAVAAVLVLSLVAGSLVLREPAGLYELAYQPTSDDVSESSFGGNPGATWVLGEAGPETGAVRTDPAIPLDGKQFTGTGNGIVVGNSYVFPVIGNDGNGDLVRYDLETHLQVWSAPAPVFGAIASDGHRIYAVRYTYTQPSGNQPETKAGVLVAFDFETGDLVWEGPSLAAQNWYSHRVVVSGGTVFAIDHLGNVVAANATDGTSIWQYPERFAVAPADEERISISTFFSLEIAVNNSALFVSRPSKAVVKLDRATGKPVGSINLVDDYGADIEYPMIQATEDQLVVSAIHTGRQVMVDSDDQYYPTTLMVFDPESLELRSTSNIATFSGNAVVTDDAIYVAAPATPDSQAWLYQVNLETGDLGAPIANISSKFGMNLSASGNVLMVTTYPDQVSFVDLDTNALIKSVTIDAPNMETPFMGPVLMWNEHPIVVSGMGTVYVFTNDPVTP